MRKMTVSPGVTLDLADLLAVLQEADGGIGLELDDTGFAAGRGRDVGRVLRLGGRLGLSGLLRLRGSAVSAGSAGAAEASAGAAAGSRLGATALASAAEKVPCMV